MHATDSVRSSIRSLIRAPRFALTAAAILALGIGLSTAVFTVADALLLRRLPMRDQKSLITLWARKLSGDVDHWPLELRTARAFARRTRTLQGVAYVAYEGAWPVAVRDGDQLTRLRRALVSGNYFDVLGAHPVLGRALRTTDDVVGAAPVAVISYEAWQQRFGGDPNVLSKSLSLAEFGTTYAIVGVMPRGLEYPAGADLSSPFVPARLHTDPDPTAYTALDLVGRLAPGATIADAAPSFPRSMRCAARHRNGASSAAARLRRAIAKVPRLWWSSARAWPGISGRTRIQSDSGWSCRRPITPTPSWASCRTHATAICARQPRPSISRSRRVPFRSHRRRWRSARVGRPLQ